MKKTNIPIEKRVFCSRTLNLNSIKAIGYDMDYTLIQYNDKVWEERAYAYTKARFLENGWPVENLNFNFDIVTRALIIDKELGNIVKANKFGYVKKAAHGTKILDFKEMRTAYPRTLVDPASSRYAPLDTLFSLSEACIYSQLVDMYDKNLLPDVTGYEDLYNKVRTTLDEAHFEGVLKQEIISNPKKFVELDPMTPQTLLEQKESGKILVLITNSDYLYTDSMMSYAFNKFLPDKMKWQELFSLIIVSARKPYFFTNTAPVFEYIQDNDLLRQCFGPIKKSGIYVGGNFHLVEDFLGFSGDKILYVGDHIFTDIILSKSIVKWRSAMVLKEFELELKICNDSMDSQRELDALMSKKEMLETDLCNISLHHQKSRLKINIDNKNLNQIEKQMANIRSEIQLLDTEISPLVIKEGQGFNKIWGYLMRTGNDKSHLMSQIEKYADLYTSRVSNFKFYTPFKLFRPERERLPHDPC